MKYKCLDCEKEFDKPKKVYDKEEYDCLYGYLDRCCPFCLSARLYGGDDDEEE